MCQRGPSATWHRHSALAGSGAHTDTGVPSVKCGAHVSSSLHSHFLPPPDPCFCSQSIAGTPRGLRACTGGDDACATTSIPEALMGAAPAPAADVQPCLETFLVVTTWGEGVILASSGWRSEMRLLNMLQCTGQSRQQRVLCPKCR